MNNGTSKSRRTDTPPAFGDAEPGSVLGQLDHWRAARAVDRNACAATRREILERRALASLRGAPDPHPHATPSGAAPRLTPVEEPEPGTVAWTIWAAAKSPQQPEYYQRETAAYEAARFEELVSGKVQPSTTRRIDYDEQAGAFTSRRRTRGGSWSTPTVIASCEQRPCRLSKSAAGGPRGRARGPRGATRRRNTHSHRSSASRSRAPSSDSDGSEPGPGPDRLGGEPFAAAEAEHAARQIASVWDSLTPARFEIATSPFLFGLEGEQLVQAKRRVFLALPDRLQRSLYHAIRVGHATWMPPGADRDRPLRCDQDGGVS